MYRGGLKFSTINGGREGPNEITQSGHRNRAKIQKEDV